MPKIKFNVNLESVNTRFDFLAEMKRLFMMNVKQFATCPNISTKSNCNK